MRAPGHLAGTTGHLDSAWPAAARGAVGLHLVIIGIKNRTCGAYLAAIHRILISVSVKRVDSLEGTRALHLAFGLMLGVPPLPQHSPGPDPDPQGLGCRVKGPPQA
jgi:hypothetical protein